MNNEDSTFIGCLISDIFSDQIFFQCCLLKDNLQCAMWLTVWLCQDIWVMGKSMCLLVPFIELTVSHTSVLTILAITVERWRQVSRGRCPPWPVSCAGTTRCACRCGRGSSGPRTRRGWCASCPGFSPSSSPRPCSPSQTTRSVVSMWQSM